MSGLPGRGRLLARSMHRPTLEVHVPIAPTSSFLRQLHCLTHSLRRFGGAYRDAPVIATVGGVSRSIPGWPSECPGWPPMASSSAGCPTTTSRGSACSPPARLG